MIGVLGFDIPPFTIGIYGNIKHYYVGGEILEDWKIKISVLWLFRAMAVSTYSMLMLTEPGVLEEIITGKIFGMQIEPGFLLIGAIESLVPLVMAFLSLILKDSINRWANIILGIVYTALNIISSTDAPSAHGALMWGSAAVATAMIVWYAWKSKQKA